MELCLRIHLLVATVHFNYVLMRAAKQEHLPPAEAAAGNAAAPEFS